MLKNLYDFIVVGNQKAVIAFALTFIGGLGLQVGGVNILDVTVRELIASGITGAIASAGVYIKGNNK